MKPYLDFISVKNVFQPFAQNSEILANKDDFGGKGVIIGSIIFLKTKSEILNLLGKNEQEIYEDNEKNPSVENLNEENSKNYGSSNTNKAESQQQNQPRNDRFLEVFFFKFFFIFIYF